MKNTLFTALVICSAFVYGQNPVFPTYVQLNAGDKAVVFGDNVNLRQSPGKDAPVTGKLQAGDRVRILEQSAQILTLNFRTEHWYKVASPAGEAYVWGGMLALSSADTAGITFALNLTPEGARMRAIRQGKVLHETGCGNLAAPIGNQFPPLNISGPMGLSGYQFMVSMTMDIQVEICGADQHLVVLWNGAALHPLPVVGSGVDAPVYATETYIFPAQAGGQPNAILMVREEGEYEVDNDDFQYDKTIRVRRLKWDGKQFPEPVFERIDD